MSERELSEMDRIEHNIFMEFKPYYIAMCREIARHVPEKGYGYRNSAWIEYFKYEAVKLSARYAWANESNPDEALDAGAMLAFAWMHETGKFDCLSENIKGENNE